MKHLSSIVLAAAVVAAGAVACFKDPTSSLRNGPSQVLLTRSSVFIPVGDSLSVQAEVKDDQGNTFDVADAAWTSSDPAVAVVNADTSRPIPLHIFSRAFIRATGGGDAVVHFTSHGISDSIAVVAMPVSFAGAVTYPAGLMMADTITIAATPVLTFTDSTTVTIGGVPAVLLSQTPGLMKMVAGGPVAAGSTVQLTHLLLLGRIDMSLTATTTVAVASTVRGGSATVNAATYNVGDTITVTANGTVSFSVAAGKLSAVTVDSIPTWLVSQTATQIKVIAPMAAAGSAVKVSNVILLGSVPLPSLDAATTVTVTEANEPANNSPATPSTMALYTDYYGTVSGSDGDDYIQFTTPATGDSVHVEVQWLSDADLDIGLLLGDGSGNCAPNAGACYSTMGTSANPEKANFRLLASTTYQLDVYVYDPGAAPLTFYRVRVTKLQ